MNTLPTTSAIALAILMAIPPLPAPAQTTPVWTVSKEDPITPVQNGAHHHKIHLTQDRRQVRLQAVTFDSARFRIQVLDQPNPKASARLISELMPQAKAVAGINGGFFTPAFKPMGLMIANGKSTGSFESSALLGGCILQTATRPAILWRTEYQSSKGITQLIQCGPRLVNNRIPIPGLEKQKQRPRSFVATDANSALWAIGTTGPCTLAELAQILSSPNILPNLRISRAINLDGGSSTAFWYQPTQGSAISQPGWDTVRNYLAIIPK